MTTFIPHNYQAYAKDWIINNAYCGLFLDMGLGKTVTTLTAINELLYEYFEIENVLVIAPLRVAEKTWSDEIQKWDHLQHLTISKVMGSAKAREAALQQKADIYVTNRENVVWLVEYYGRNWPFQTVVIDELSSFKNPAAKRFKALRKVRPLMKRVIGLTGTPAPNSLIDLWPQVYLLDRGERLEERVTWYRSKYFTPGQHDGHVVYNWQLIKGADKVIYNKIGDICVSMKKEDYLDMPELIYTTDMVTLTAKEKALYKQLEKDYILELPKGDVTAANAAVLANKLQQMAEGAIYDEDRSVQVIHEQKVNVLKEIVEEAQGEPILCFYNYQHGLDRIKKAFPQARELKTNQDIDDWNEGKIPLLLAHPKSTGHGLNLQQGGHIAVWFSLTWSLELFQQAVARLMRQGQEKPVIMHQIVAEGTIDERIIKSIEGKEKNQDSLLQAVMARIEEVRQDA